MPKLSSDTAKKVSNAEGGSGFQLMTPGIYTLKLTEVEATTSKADNPMWIWQFQVSGGQFNGVELREYTVITDKALWKLNSIFQAFGVPASTHTDDLIGKTVRASIENEVISQGRLKGEQTNRIRNYLEPSAAPESASTSNDDEDELPY